MGGVNRGMPEAKNHSFPCPACGFLTFVEPSGSYDICVVCGWEDDHVQLTHPSSPIGANGESLFEAQQRVLRDLPLEVRERGGLIRDPTWRPLTEPEARSPRPPSEGQSYFEAAAGDSPSYYWREPTSQ